MSDRQTNDLLRLPSISWCNRYEGIPKMVSLLYETQSRQRYSQVYTVFHWSKVIVDTILSQRLFFPSFKKKQF